MFPIQDSIPTRPTPIGARALILINVLVFFFELTLSRRGVEQLAYVGSPAEGYSSILSKLTHYPD
jgi:membrane associated rhomboid family serine protease